MQENLNKYSNTILSKQIFGLTLGLSKNNPTQTNMSEMDMFDIFIYYGLIGVIVLVSYLIIILIVAIIKYFINFKENINDNELNSYILSYGLALLIAFTAGHTLSAPAVSLFIALNICYIIKKLKFFKTCKKELPIKIIIVGFIIYILVALIIIFTNQKEKVLIELSLENNELIANKEIVKIEEQEINFEGINDNLKYYAIESFKNIQIIYVTRTFENNNTIEFIVLNNNENITIDFEIIIMDNLNDYKRNSNYLYAVGDNYKLISNTYYYVASSKDVHSFNKYTYKNLIKESTDYLTENNEVIKKIELKANETADTYIISSPKKITNVKNLPWISFNGYYQNLQDNLYVRSYNIAPTSSSVLKEIFIDNYLINMSNYTNYSQGIWYKDYYIISNSSFEKNNLFISATTNYIINKNMESLGINSYSDFTELIKKHYYEKRYLETENGIIFNSLTDSSFIEQINITNILLRDYLTNNDYKSKQLAMYVLNEIESDQWLNGNNNFYEYITSDLKYMGNISDPLIIFSLIELKNNLEESQINNNKIKEYINVSFEKLSETLTEDQLKILEEGDYFE